MNIESKETILYSFSELKKSMKKGLNNSMKEKIELFTTSQRIFDEMYVKNLYTNIESPEEVYLNKKDVELILLLTETNFNLNLPIDKIKSRLMDEKIIHYVCNSYEEYRQNLKNHKQTPEIQKILQERKEYEQSLQHVNQPYCKDVQNISLDLKGKKVVCLDFEFKQFLGKIKFENCTEFGISILENGKITKEHYLLTETYLNKVDRFRYLQYSFLHGKTEFMSVKDVKSFLEKHISNADYLLFHEMSTELKILENNNISFEQVKILDTQKMQNNFEVEKGQGRSLKDVLKYHNIESNFLHNSGNDAAYTLEALVKMFETYHLTNKPKRTILKI